MPDCSQPPSNMRVDPNKMGVRTSKNRYCGTPWGLKVSISRIQNIQSIQQAFWGMSIFRWRESRGISHESTTSNAGPFFGSTCWSLMRAPWAGEREAQEPFHVLCRRRQWRERTTQAWKSSERAGMHRCLDNNTGNLKVLRVSRVFLIA